MVPSAVVQAAQWLACRSMRLLTGLAAMALALVAGAGPTATPATGHRSEAAAVAAISNSAGPTANVAGAAECAGRAGTAGPEGGAEAAGTFAEAVGTAARSGGGQADPAVGYPTTERPIGEPAQPATAGAQTGEPSPSGVLAAAPAAPRAPPLR